LQILGGTEPPPGQFPGTLRLTGISAAAGSYAFTLVFGDSAGHQVRRTYNLKVTTLGFSNLAMLSPMYGVPFPAQVNGFGGVPPYSFTLASGLLPAGLTLSNTGAIAGTPGSTGNYPISIKVQDSTGASTTQSSALYVGTPGGNFIDVQGPSLVPDGSVGVNRSIYLYPNNTDGTHAVTWTMEPGSHLPEGMALVDAATLPDWPGYIDGEATIIGAPKAPGVYLFSVRATEAVTGTYGIRNFKWTVSPLQLALYGRPPVGRVDTPYSFQIPVAGGTPPYYFSWQTNAVKVPGLDVSSSGQLSGKPSAPGRWNAQLQVSDSAGNSLPLSVYLTTVEAGQTPPMTLWLPTTPFTTDAAVGQPYLLAMNRMIWDGVPWFQWSGTPSTPDGLQFADGFLIGTPTASSDAAFTLGVRDSSPGGQPISVPGASFRVSPVRVSPDVLPPATVGSFYSQSLTASGGVAPVTMQLSPWSSMPGGLSYSGGVISGTPTSAGVFNIYVEVRDANTPAIQPYYRSYSLVVGSAATPYPYLTVDPGVVRVTYEKSGPPPVTPVNIGGTADGQAFTASVVGIVGASLSVTSGSTPRVTNLALDPNMPIGEYMGAIVLNPAVYPAVPQVAALVYVSVKPAPACTYGAAPSGATVAAAGGSGTVSITTPSWCAWTVVSNQPWVSLAAPTGGTSAGTVSYTVPANSNPEQRSATITVLDGTGTAVATQAVTQFGTTCSYAINPVTLTTGPAAGSGVVTITASASGCPWSVTNPSAPALTFTGPTSGTGSGSVAFSITANGGGTMRPLTATIAGQTFTVNQAGLACIGVLSPPSATVSAAGGPVSVGLALPSGCAYDSSTSVSWARAAAGGSGLSDGLPHTVELTVDANSTTVARATSLTIAGQPFAVSQQGVACSVTVSGANPVIGSRGSTGSFTVTANGGNCDWNSTSSAPWLRITGGASGLGNGTVNFAADSNASSTSPRSATLTIAGQALTITEAGTTCTYSLRSSSGTMPYSGGNGSVGLVTAPVCTWTAVSDSAWLSVSPASGTGGADISFTAQANPSPAPRTPATITVTGAAGAPLTFTVAQPGAPCTVSLTATATAVSKDGGLGSFPFTMAPGCAAPTVQSFAGWLSVSTPITYAQATGVGTVAFSAEVNPAGAGRSGVIQVNDAVFTVTETAASCSYTLNTIGARFDHNGGPGSFTAGENVVSCSPTVVANPGITLDPRVQTGNLFTQSYTVAPYSSLTPWVRLLYIDFGGQIYKVKQTSW
jgi:hypothetical protein